MAIIKDGATLKVYKGDGKPANIYKGTEKIAGWKTHTATGESPLVPDTYNDDCSLTIKGKTIEVGTGAKNYSNPYTIASASDFDLVSCGKNLTSIQDQSIIVSDGYYQNYFPQNPKILLKPNTQYTLSFDYNINSASLGVGCGIGYGASGYAYDLVAQQSYPNQTSGRFAHIFTTPSTFSSATPYLQLRFARVWTQGSFNVDISNIMITIGTNSNHSSYTGQTTNFPHTIRSLPNGMTDEIIINNTDGTAKLIRRKGRVVLTGVETMSLYNSGVQFFDVRPTMAASAYPSDGHCSHCPIGFSYSTLNTVRIFSTNLTFQWYAWFQTVVDFRAYVTAQYNAGTPVVVEYQLATPTETILPYEAVKTWIGETQISTNAVVKPALTGTFRVIEN